MHFLICTGQGLYLNKIEGEISITEFQNFYTKTDKSTALIAD